jgi:tRNA(Ile2) C34 agmatinyltransferase TiaS
MDTVELMSSTREQRLAEVGTEPACPFCQRALVSRSDYIRCNRCGINWLNEEMHLPGYLERDPRVARSEAARMAGGTRPTAGTSKGDVED